MRGSSYLFRSEYAGLGGGVGTGFTPKRNNSTLPMTRSNRVVNLKYRAPCDAFQRKGGGKSLTDLLTGSIVREHDVGDSKRTASVLPRIDTAVMRK